MRVRGSEIFGLGILIMIFKTYGVVLLIKSGLKDPVKRLGGLGKMS